MDCALCAAYLAMKHDVKAKGVKMPYCAGCRPRGKRCAYLRKWCPELREERVEFCHECARFPCSHLKNIDKRYRERYQTSFIANLESIRDRGLETFLVGQRSKWRCPRCGGTICCHNGLCFGCDIEELRKMKQKYRWKGDPGARKTKRPRAAKGRD
jgi:hypothetical protein